MKLIVVALSLLLIIIFVRCVNNNPEKLYPQTVECDTAQISFNRDVAPIFKNNCESCHTGSFPGGGRLLDSYEGIKNTADSGQLLGAINHLSGYKAMPPDRKISDCNIHKITAWINQGTRNN